MMCHTAGNVRQVHISETVLHMQVCALVGHSLTVIVVVCVLVKEWMFAVDKKGRVQRVNCAAATSVKILRSVNECHETSVNEGEVNTCCTLLYLVYLTLRVEFLALYNDSWSWEGQYDIFHKLCTTRHVRLCLRGWVGCPECDRFNHSIFDLLID